MTHGVASGRRPDTSLLAENSSLGDFTGTHQVVVDVSWGQRSALCQVALQCHSLG